LDLGGTNSVFGIVDSRGEIKATTAIKTQGYGNNVQAYVDAAVEALQIIIDQVGGIGKIKAMGIGAPNGNYYNGTIEFAPNLEWGRDGVVPLAKLFSDKLGIPVALTNDANAAAIGEMTYGVARGMKNFIVITLGTGVGSGIVVNGQLVYGCDGFAGELGHVIVKENGRDCGCGRKGCLETYCSATGVARSAREFLANSDEPSLLRELDPEKITSYDVSMAAAKGDKIALAGNLITGVDFMKESDIVEVVSDASTETVLFGEMPVKTNLRVTHSEPGIKGDTATNTLKPATLETGVEIRVPLFVNEGDLVQVDTRDGSYLQRVKE
jgi:glucokinase